MLNLTLHWLRKRVSCAPRGTIPFIFLATDLTVRIFGAPLARRIILSVIVPVLFISYVISTVTYQGEWQGLTARWAASFMAYVLGKILDVHVFNRLRQCSNFWVAPAAAMLFGNISDTLSFFFIAFYHSSDVFMSANWVEIALVDYSFKVLICMLFFLPMYGMLLNVLLKCIAVHGDGLQRNLKFEENL
ncbi:queuosine precursor transporter [Serratia symbiotica]|nr:queuosine precursor transporter [Serratia symbiotica]